MQEAVLKLKELGAPPEGFEGGGGTFPPEEILDLWDAYQDAVEAIRRPVAWEEAEILIQCCPTDRMAGVEWTLLHAIESVLPAAPENALRENSEGLDRYGKLIRSCNSDMMREMLSERLEAVLSSI